MTEPIDTADFQQIERVMDGVGLNPARLLDFMDGPSDLGWRERDEAIFTSAVDFGSVLSRLFKAILPYRLNLETLDSKLRDAFDKEGVGYCYMIRKNGKLVHVRSVGWAQRPGDGDLAWSYPVPMDIGSLTKFITAAAIMRLLGTPEKEALPILPYLPAYWAKGAGIDKVTFSDLLQHKSGLGGAFGGSGPADFKSAKEAIAAGSTGTGGDPDYKNINYIILRVIAATYAGAIAPGLSIVTKNSGLWDFIAGPLGEVASLTAETATDALWDAVTTTWYIKYVNENVFLPAGVDARDLRSPENSAKAYFYPSSGTGSRIEDASTQAGEGGWHLGMDELLTVLGAIRHGNRIISTERARRMLTQSYGIDGFIATDAGNVYTKNGRAVALGLNQPTKTKMAVLLIFQSLDADMYLMPGNAELAIFVNAARDDGSRVTDGVPALIRSSTELNLF